MGTRTSIEQGLMQAHEVYDEAKKQMEKYRKQEHYNQTEYAQAQMQLLEMLEELETLRNSGNAQQKDDIFRIQAQLRQLLNDMVLDQNDILH